MAMEIKKNKFFLISLGAIPGALFRWNIDDIVIVNLIGCFLLGFFNSFTITKRYKLTFGVGLCASMTTFSGWSYKLYSLLNDGLYRLLIVNSVLLVFISGLAIALGHLVAKKLNS